MGVKTSGPFMRAMMAMAAASSTVFTTNYDNKTNYGYPSSRKKKGGGKKGATPRKKKGR